MYKKKTGIIIFSAVAVAGCFVGAAFLVLSQRSNIVKPAAPKLILLDKVAYPFATSNGRIDSWCQDDSYGAAYARSEKKDIGGWWVNTENFNGMYHCASIQHICYGNTDMFRIDMASCRADDAAEQKAYFVTPDDTAAFSFTVSKDSFVDASTPKFDFLGPIDPSAPNQAWMNVGNGTYIYDKGENKFYKYLGTPTTVTNLESGSVSKQ
jgi:hypothetical protein